MSFSYGKRLYYPDFLVCVGEKMYVLETKGDPYSDQRKNQLLKEVERATEGGVKAVLAFSDWIEGFGGDAESLEGFMIAAEQDSSRRLQFWDLEYAPPESGKYIEYMPVYSPEKAMKKWVKGRDGVRCEGWAKIENPRRSRYSDSCFALQNRSRHLDHLGPWLIVDSSSRNPERGQSALLRYAEFDDVYRRGYSVRTVSVRAERTGGLIDDEVWELGREDDEKFMRLRPGKQSFDVIGLVVEHRS